MFFKNWKNHGGSSLFSFLSKAGEREHLWHIFGLHRDKKTKEAVQKLIDKSRLETSFFVMCGLSGILAALGILLNDIPILISAMVLAPLLNTILAFAAGIALFNKTLVFYAAKNFFGSMIFIILVTALFTKILLLEGNTFDISSFSQKFSNVNTLFFFAAFVSGFSGVYSWLRAKDLSNLIGVAIAVSLIPFVSFFGVLLGMGLFAVIQEFILPFFINLFSIILGSLTAFILLGFSRKRDDSDIEKGILQEIDHHTEI